LIRQVRRSENPITFALRLKFVEQASGDTEPPVGCVHVNQAHKTTVKKFVIHEAVAKKTAITCCHETFTIIDRTLDKSTPRYSRRVDCEDLFDVGADRKSNHALNQKVLQKAEPAS
jgi:hypothetical protein